MATLKEILGQIKSISEVDGIFLSSEKFKAKMGELDSIVDEYLKEKVDDYVDQNLKVNNQLGIKNDVKTNERIKQESEFVRDLRVKLSTSTSIREPIIGISKQLLAFGAAGLALTVGFADKIAEFDLIMQKIIMFIGILYFNLVLLSIIVLIMYLLQARYRYPFLYFKKIGNVWPWFYYSSISDHIPRSPIGTYKSKLKSGRYYSEDILKFFHNFFDETPSNWLRMELQQYFLLISYQGYVNQFSLRLANIFLYGFVGSIVVSIGLFILSALLNIF